MMTPKRLTRAEWQRIVASWRRSGGSAKEFAASHRLAEGTLRWWSWALQRKAPSAAARRATAAVTMVPVRVVELEGKSVDAASVGADLGSVAWTLRTTRREVHVYASSEHVEELRVAIAMLVGGGS